MGRRGQAGPDSPLSPELAAEVADAMFALSTPTRVQILYALLDRPHDVSELTELLGLEQSAVSHQLRVLREHALVRVERGGTRRVYSLADHHIVALLHQAKGHAEHRRGDSISRARRAV
jgi:DNA-binding transcriptional ArsR family regulator